MLMNQNDSLPIDREFERMLAEARCKLDKEMLTDEDLLVLAAAEIARTYTYGEKGYK
ncbi:MAG: hypothetical protein GF401_14290 [Chitinivibrionales bacterium]|nr:hypothetical protein [Chitinivibrionales bacterium]